MWACNLKQWKNICFQGRTESLDLLTQLNLQIWNILFKEKIGPRWVEISQWSGSGLRGSFCEFAKKWNCQFYFELKFKVYGHLCIRNLSYAKDFTNVTLAYEDDWRVWASQVVFCPSNYSIGPFYPLIDHVIWHALCRSQLLHLQSYNVRFTGAFQQWALGGRQGEGPMRL